MNKYKLMSEYKYMIKNDFPVSYVLRFILDNADAFSEELDEFETEAKIITDFILGQG